MIIDNLVIGSGPTGITVASQLLKKNKKVFLIDIGNEIENQNLTIKDDYLNHKNYHKFIKEIKKNKKIYYKYENPNLKFPFGSDYVFRKNIYEKIQKHNVDYITSNAVGGLSNIWATLVSPFYRQDISDWDIQYDEYYKYLKNVEEIMPISSTKDNLDNFFDLEIGSPHLYNLSDRSKYIMSLLKNKKIELNKNGIFFGRSKTAVGNKYSQGNINCQECGLCHYGCPYDCMFSSKYVLNDLIKDKNFQYINHHFAYKIFQDKNSNNGELMCININNQSKVKFQYNKIFISCGPISSAMLILRSKLIDKKEILLKESQRFYIPIFLKKKPSFNYEINKNTLPEIFFEIYNNAISNQSIHLQLYSFSEIMLKPFEKIMGNYANSLPKILPFVFNNIFVLLGYMHSKDSNSLNIKYDGTFEDISNYTLSPLNNIDTKKIVIDLLNLLRKELNFFIINSTFLNNSKTGSSYHYGGSFPMTNKTNIENSTNLKGKLNNYENIYITDQSVLPEMPGAPTTFNAMINAARIANDMLE